MKRQLGTLPSTIILNMLYCQAIVFIVPEKYDYRMLTSYTTRCQNLIGCSTLSQDLALLQADWLILENNEKACLNIDMHLYIEYHELYLILNMVYYIEYVVWLCIYIL